MRSVDTRDLYITLGKRIQSFRKAVGLTQSDFADKLELSRTSIANIEAGRQKVSLHLLYGIAELLDLAPQELLPEPAQVEAQSAKQYIRAGNKTVAVSKKSEKIINKVVRQTMNFSK